MAGEPQAALAAVRTFGLALIGFGVSVIGYAVERRTLGVALTGWFFWGTAGLIVLNAGVACFGKAVKRRVLLELRRDAP